MRWNYRRGIQRAYFTAWLVYAAFSLPSIMHDRPRSGWFEGNTSATTKNDVFDELAAADRFEFGRRLLFAEVVAPGAAYVVLFAVLPWVGRGFRKAEC